jgi:hypothetical protein
MMESETNEGLERRFVIEEMVANPIGGKAG